jgi:hypothetical protein
MFSCSVDDLNLREVKMSGRRFTWANALPNLKLHRILMSIEWELKFPLSPLIALSRDISDHTPLLIDTRNTSSGNNQPMFKFELGWLLRDGFKNMFREVWESVCDKTDKMKCWQSKIKRLRQHLHG